MKSNSVRQVLYPLIRKRDMYERTPLNIICCFGWIIALWGIGVYFCDIPKGMGVILLLAGVISCSIYHFICHFLYRKYENKISKLQNTEEYNKIALNEERNLLYYYQEQQFLNSEIPYYKRKIDSLQSVIKERESLKFD